MRFGIIGMGRIGSSLYFSLRDTEFTFSGYYSRSPMKEIGESFYREIKDIDADIYFFTLPDRIINLFSEMIEKKDRYFVHCSGYFPSDILGKSRVLSLHPMFSVNKKFTSLKGISWAIEGDEDGISLGKRIVNAINGKYYILRKEDKPLYHIACVIGTNLVNTLLYYSSEILKNLRIDEKEILRLASSVIENSKDSGILNALTGPIERGDYETIENELIALKKNYPHLFYSLIHIIPLNAQMGIMKGRDEKEIIDFINRLSSLRG
jgi:predicted short-subunit dehydrogenase-like oxidoreductase (DUF2520 family)